MKKFIAVLVLLVAISTQAQQKKGNSKMKYTVEQRATLAVKKMTLALYLTDKQQQQIKPLLVEKMTAMKTAQENRKKAKEEKERPTADEMYAMQLKRLDNQIAMRNKMKKILTDEQFDQFLKLEKKRKGIAMKKGKKQHKGNHTERG
ncbi:hypothetical protein N9V96_03100 [Polaribacter sp.]|nr:hypothetical protein [Polaribacter sp.]